MYKSGLNHKFNEVITNIIDIDNSLLQFTSDYSIKGKLRNQSLYIDFVSDSGLKKWSSKNWFNKWRKISIIRANIVPTFLAERIWLQTREDALHFYEIVPLILWNIFISIKIRLFQWRSCTKKHEPTPWWI